MIYIYAYGEDRFVKRVEKEFKNQVVSVDASRRPDVSVRFGKFDVPSGLATSRGSGLFVDKNVIFARESFRGARFEFMLSGLEDSSLQLDFSGNILSLLVAVKQYVEPAIRYVLELSGRPMVHSTFLVKENSGALVAASGGAGKTTLLLRWIEENPVFLSDDFTIISEGRALSYVTPLRLGFRNLLESPLLRNMSLRDHGEIAVRTALRHMLMGKARLAFKKGIEELVPSVKIVSDAKLESVVLLRGMARRLEAEKISAQDMAKAVAKINREEMYRYPFYIETYARSFPESPLFGFFDAHEKRILANIQNLPCFAIKIPQTWTDNEWLEFKKMIFP